MLRLESLLLAGLAVGSGAAKIKHHHPISPPAVPLAVEPEPLLAPEPEPPPPVPPARAFGQVPSAPLPQVARVSGRVLDGDEPLGETTLEMENARHTVVVTTDVDGRFDTSIAPGIYTITINGDRAITFNANAGNRIELTPIHTVAREQEAILDQEDRCPDEPEDVNGFRDNDGCPDRPRTQEITY